MKHAFFIVMVAAFCVGYTPCAEAGITTLERDGMNMGKTIVNPFPNLKEKKQKAREERKKLEEEAQKQEVLEIESTAITVNKNTQEQTQ